jgi:ABC-2 type transport system permease protein
MIEDALAVAWKDWRELARARTTRVGALLMLLVFGVFLPLNERAGGPATPLQLVAFPFVPFVLTIPNIADAIAGERERHTLETLLATRLDDGSILVGKLLGVLVPVWMGTAVVYAAAIVTTNVQFGNGQLLLPPLWSVLATFAAIVLVPGLLASIGIFVSMRSNTVRKAAQMLSLFVMAFAFLPMVLARALPHDWLVALQLTLESHSPKQIGLAIAAGLLLVDIAIVAAALARFRRGRLVLD